MSDARWSALHPNDEHSALIVPAEDLRALEAENARLRREADLWHRERDEYRSEAERLRVTRDHQRVEIEWLRERLHQIVLVAQRAERGRP